MSVLKGTTAACILVLMSLLICLFQASRSLAQVEDTSIILLQNPNGKILYSLNPARDYSPASTLKILTALIALEHLGPDYRFETKFFLSADENLKIKGYGDPMLLSEVWRKIAQSLSLRVHEFSDLVVDRTFFQKGIEVPGVGSSTNPYDAPNGALCANFNTVFFRRDRKGAVLSAEPQTPVTPLAVRKINELGLKGGRHSVFRGQDEVALYAGELLNHFLQEKGVICRGVVRTGSIDPKDRLVYTYRSIYSLGEVLEKMLTYSNNFVANQVLILLGANVMGAPGNLEKGVRVARDYSIGVLGLRDIEIVEGSGISKENRLSALEMLTILKRFEPYRWMLPVEDGIRFKSGSLGGLRTRAGYLENGGDSPHSFVLVKKGPHPNMNRMMRFLLRLYERFADPLLLHQDLFPTTPGVTDWWHAPVLAPGNPISRGMQGGMPPWSQGEGSYPDREREAGNLHAMEATVGRGKAKRFPLRVD